MILKLSIIEDVCLLEAWNTVVRNQEKGLKYATCPISSPSAN